MLCYRPGMEMTFLVRDFTQTELLAVEYALRQIVDRDKSSVALDLACTLRAEIGRRARDTLSDGMFSSIPSSRTDAQ